MFHRYSTRKFLLLAAFAFVVGFPLITRGQDSPFPQATDLQHGPPLTNQEYVSMLYQLPRHPEDRDRIVDEIRKRGIAFTVTPGLLSLTATKSGNDPVLRRTLEEANRRRENPVGSTLPPSAESATLLEQTRRATLGAAGTMPDYLVKELIVRYVALGTTKNWQTTDHLSVAVSYRQTAGEDYKLLSINGMPAAADEDYGISLGGTVSAGEYVTVLSDLFKPETQAEFQAVDTDMVNKRATIVYEYVVKREFSRQGLGWGRKGRIERETVVGSRGRIWVDRQNYRVLRFESIATEIEPGFPITAESKVIDYDWVTINDKEHLLPSRAVVELTAREGVQTEQTRNDILFRGYRKFGTEVKITDINEKDFPPDKPEESDSTKQPAPPLDSKTPIDPNKPPPVPILKPKKP
ncbi:MAG TPA: hypothetical protein VGP81_14860 [Pyrinomonadaceae bacterium]|jgi:hypothetical protein|nr:hypothetical protein [Pyrinomonadaceae bacterium]